MSCQQALRYTTSNNSNSISGNAQANSNCKNLNNSQNHINIKGNRTAKGIIQQEDPYVFTETVPTTPPILFNTQKSRTRLNDVTAASNIGKLQLQKLPLTETNGKITSISNHIKKQAPFLTTTPITKNGCTVPASKNNVIKSITGSAAIKSNNSNNKKLTNVCVVRPQLQTPQSLYHHQQNYINSLNEYDGDLKSISPPPLYTPPTPSLWQTPLLLESTTSTSANTSPKVNNVVVQRSPTTTSQTIPIVGCATPTVQTAGSVTTTMSPPLTMTAMAKVAPIVVQAPLPVSPSSSPNQCLPPSKFHNHTLAQHIQKVECLKMNKKSTETENFLCNGNVNSMASPLKSPSPMTLSTANSLVDKAVCPIKHSENEDFSEIPVNVIFRTTVVSQANEKCSSNIQYVKPQNGIDTTAQTPLPQSATIPSPLPPPSPPPTPQPTQTATSLANSKQLITNINQKMSTPASKTTITKQLIKSQQINTSSTPHQQQLEHVINITTATTNNTSFNSHPTPNESDDTDGKNSTTEISTKLIAHNSKTIITNLNAKLPTHISNKMRKFNLFPSVNFNVDYPQVWQMGCSTKKGSVAVVKMSQHNADLDKTHLATVIGLPYCLQQYWLNPYNFCKYSSELLMKSNSVINRSLAREERIAVYKQQLRRKAIQLISTRSLQKLPIQLAKRRLLCVDRLLRKYQQNEEHKKDYPANVKRCSVNGCVTNSLELASYCQQHIVHNAAQHVFLPCTAKFADNTQCRIPVFDITHDLPLCMEHARKRDAYNRHLYEQRPRKISTNSMQENESIVLSSKIAGTNSKAGGTIVAGAGMNIQNYLQKHQQQMPLNNSSGAKRQTFAIQQASRKRKMTTGGSTVDQGDKPQKRIKKTVEKAVCISTTSTIEKRQMPRLTSSSLKRKNSTTSLESIASNSQHSTTSSTSQHQRQQLHQHLHSTSARTSSLAPPALAPLSNGLVGHGLPQHLFSFGHDNQHHQNLQNQIQQQQPQQLHPVNLNEKHSFAASTNSTTTVSTPTELKDFISQFSFLSQKHTPAEITTSDINLLNTNSNSNFTSSAMGSTTSLPTADDFLTQDMLSICENSSASSADTGLGGLSDPELMFGGPEDDIPLGDTHLLEEHDLENVLNSLPDDAFKELFTTVHQDESDEIERAIELADKHLKTLQQTIGSELGDFLDFSDDMLMNSGDLCNASANSILDTTALFIGGGTMGSQSVTVAANTNQIGGGLVQT